MLVTCTVKIKGKDKESVQELLRILSQSMDFNQEEIKARVLRIEDIKEVM